MKLQKNELVYFKIGGFLLCQIIMLMKMHAVLKEH